MARRDDFTQSAIGIPFDNSGTDYDSDNVQEALEEVKDIVLSSVDYAAPFQFIGQMNYDQYLISGYHIVSSGFRRSGDPSNGARYTNAAPLVSPVDGEIYKVSAAIRGVAQSTGSPASTVTVKFELWEVGMTGSEGTKIGDIEIPIDSSTYTIGNYWNSSVVTNFQGGNNITPVTVSQGQLLGLKFINQTGSDKAVSVENVTLLLSMRIP